MSYENGKPVLEDSMILTCVNCEFNNTHLFRIEPKGTNLDSDRFSVVLTFYCEGCDIYTALLIDNHKGETYFERRPIHPSADIDFPRDRNGVLENRVVVGTFFGTLEKQAQE